MHRSRRLKGYYDHCDLIFSISICWFHLFFAFGIYLSIVSLCYFPSVDAHACNGAFCSSVPLVRSLSNFGWHLAEGACYKCGSLEHSVMQCPLRSEKEMAKSLQQWAQEAQDQQKTQNINWHPRYPHGHLCGYAASKFGSDYNALT